MANLDEIAARNPIIENYPQTFSDFIRERFDIEFNQTENPNILVTSIADKPISLVGTWYASGGWCFSINGNNFSARGDLPHLPLDQRQDELFNFMRKIGV